MKKILLLCLLSTSLLAQTIALEFAWDPNPPEDAVMYYRLFMSTNILGPYVEAGTTTNGTQTNIWIQSAIYGQGFYYLVAYNMWTNSEPSEKVFTPPAYVHPVSTLEIIAKAFSKDAVTYIKALSEKRRIKVPAPPLPK